MLLAMVGSAMPWMAVFAETKPAAVASFSPWLPSANGLCSQQICNTTLSMGLPPAHG
jgi:hypothetical protein